MDAHDYKRGLDRITELCQEGNYSEAFSNACGMLQYLPGNAHLYVLRALIVQLSDDHSLPIEMAKADLERAVAYSPESSDALVQLAHYHDAVEDDLELANKTSAEAVALAANMMTEACRCRRNVMDQLVDPINSL